MRRLLAGTNGHWLKGAPYRAEILQNLFKKSCALSGGNKFMLSWTGKGSESVLRAEPRVTGRRVK
jgi:hypothetical protein